MGADEGQGERHCAAVLFPLAVHCARPTTTIRGPLGLLCDGRRGVRVWLLVEVFLIAHALIMSLLTTMRTTVYVVFLVAYAFFVSLLTTMRTAVYRHGVFLVAHALVMALLTTKRTIALGPCLWALIPALTCTLVSEPAGIQITGVEGIGLTVV